MADLTSVTNGARHTNPQDVERGGTTEAVDPMLDKVSKGETHSASKIWKLYNEKTKPYDAAMLSRIKGNLDSVLIFAGLFSLVVTVFLIQSYQLLIPDNSDLTVFYLQQLAEAIVPAEGAVIPTGLSSPPAFVASRTAFAVNVLWILSLLCSLASALLATLVQAWTSRYLLAVNQDTDDAKRAIKRQWLFEGMRDSWMDAFPAFLHTILQASLFLFFAGFIVFLFPIDHRAAIVALVVVATASAIYAFFAFVDVFVSNSPYKTPFSTVLGFLTILLIVVLFASILLGIGAAVLGITLLAVLVSIPFLLSWYIYMDYSEFKDRTKMLWKKPLNTIEVISQVGAEKLIDLYDLTMDRPLTNSQAVYIGNAFAWSLEQTASIAELEEFVGGVEAFVAQSPSVRSQIILDLGGHRVGSLEVALGSCVCSLLASCSESAPNALPLERRRARADLAVHAMVATFAHSDPERRTRGIIMSEVLSVPMQSYLSWGGYPSCRWMEWIDLPLWLDVLKLRDGSDTMISLHASHLSTLIFHRAIVDLADRMERKSLELWTPANWSLLTLLAASRRVQGRILSEVALYELLIASLSILLPSSEGPEQIVAEFSMPASWEPPAASSMNMDRAISAVFRKENPVLPEQLRLVDPENMRREATLLALTVILKQTQLTTHLDLLSRVIPAIGNAIPAAGASAKLQRDFVSALEQQLQDSTNAAALQSSESGGLSTVAPSIFHMNDVKATFTWILASVDDPGCVSRARDLLSRLGPPRRPTSQADIEQEKFSPQALIAEGVLRYNSLESSPT